MDLGRKWARDKNDKATGLENVNAVKFEICFTLNLTAVIDKEGTRMILVSGVFH